MMRSTLLAYATAAALSLLVVSVPAGSAYADPQATKPCAKEQSAVAEHQEALARIQRHIDDLESKADDAGAEADWAHSRWYEARDQLREAEKDPEWLSDSELAALQEEHDNAWADYQRARTDRAAAQDSLNEAENSTLKQRHVQELARWQRELDTCLAG